MTRARKPQGPKLEALLDQRERLRVKITEAENDGHSTDYDLGDLRRRLLMIDNAVIRQWDDPNA
jgi:hypothetical protein